MMMFEVLSFVLFFFFFFSFYSSVRLELIRNDHDIMPF